MWIAIPASRWILGLWRIRCARWHSRLRLLRLLLHGPLLLTIAARRWRSACRLWCVRRLWRLIIGGRCDLWRLRRSGCRQHTRSGIGDAGGNANPWRWRLPLLRKHRLGVLRRTFGQSDLTTGWCARGNGRRQWRTTRWTAGKVIMRKRTPATGTKHCRAFLVAPLIDPWAPSVQKIASNLNDQTREMRSLCYNGWRERLAWPQQHMQLRSPRDSPRYTVRRHWRASTQHTQYTTRQPIL